MHTHPRLWYSVLWLSSDLEPPARGPDESLGGLERLGMELDVGWLCARVVGAPLVSVSLPHREGEGGREGDAPGAKVEMK